MRERKASNFHNRIVQFLSIIEIVTVCFTDQASIAGADTFIFQWCPIYSGISWNKIGDAMSEVCTEILLASLESNPNSRWLVGVKLKLLQIIIQWCCSEYLSYNMSIVMCQFPYAGRYCQRYIRTPLRMLNRTVFRIPAVRDNVTRL